MLPEEKENPRLLLEQSRVPTWLDRQETGSVIYLSFGSLAFPNVAQIGELFKALLAIGQAFIFALRSKYHEHLPPDSRFLIVDWAPQALILGHPATGVFISHCGWNSTLESMYSGVPILAWPMFADQKVNASSLVGKHLAVMVEDTSVTSTRVVSAAEIAGLLGQHDLLN